MNEHPTLRGNRRRRSISMRVLMLLILIIAVGLGCVVIPARSRLRTVSRIAEAGGIVYYDHQFSGDYPCDWRDLESNLSGASRVPVLLREWLSDAFFHHVTAVSFIGGVTDSQLDALKELDRLQAIELHRTTNLTDDGLARLEPLKSLRVVIVENAPNLTETGLAHLGRIPHLHTLALRGTRITPAGLAHLAQLKELRALQFEYTPDDIPSQLHSEGRTERLARAEEQAALGDALLARLSELSRLEKLSVDGPRITDAGLEHLGKLTALRELSLSLSDGRVTNAGLEHVGHLTQLEKLSLAGLSRAWVEDDPWYPTKVTASGWAPLAKLSGLRSLELSFCSFGDAALAQLQGFKDLRKLDLHHVAITDDGLAHLQSLVALKELSLSHTRITDSGLLHLRGLAALRELDLSHNKISDSGLAHLGNLTALEALDLSFTRVTDAGLAQVQALPKLRELNVARTRVSDEGLEGLAQTAPKLTVSRELREPIDWVLSELPDVMLEPTDAPRRETKGGP